MKGRGLISVDRFFGSPYDMGVWVEYFWAPTFVNKFQFQLLQNLYYHQHDYQYFSSYYGSCEYCLSQSAFLVRCYHHLLWLVLCTLFPKPFDIAPRYHNKDIPIYLSVKQRALSELAVKLLPSIPKPQGRKPLTGTNKA